MPLYAYKCLHCGTIFEVRHSYKDKIEKCVECSSINIHKHLGAPVKKASPKVRKKSKPAVGAVVMQTIRDGAAENKKQKKRLSTRIYKVKK